MGRRPKWYEHEKELRALVYNPDGDMPEVGEWRFVDLGALIEQVILGPSADQYLEDNVRELVARHHANIFVRRSSLSDQPIFWLASLAVMAAQSPEAVSLSCATIRCETGCSSGAQ